ncbi:ATP-binding cassette domain-containing protein [Agrobacterium vitis]|uniref:ABC transporter ATP-binding protein n=1 Tax=Agrobacterium vitis TaxID=373 RepID=UPI001F3B2109|nr:ABC transporter ATP-binding protein [Agrobacterium vitis]MCE6076420.1 ATP-binding cassette domain-containing protein [Agrobacterium vitis]
MSLKVEKLNLHYRRKQVLHGISFALRHGEFCALLGPNGSGKSTLTKALLGLAPVSAGSVHLDGENLLAQSRRDRARRIAYVPQSSPVPFDLRVYDAVMLGRSPYVGIRFSRDDHLAASDAIDKLGLASLADQYVNELSGGQQQRVMIARALAQGTRVLLLDEPTSALDLRYQVETMRLVRDFTREGGIALMAVHDLNHAARYCNRALIIADGRLVANGTPNDVFDGETLSKVFDLSIDVHRHDGLITVRPAEHHSDIAFQQPVHHLSVQRARVSA